MNHQPLSRQHQKLLMLKRTLSPEDFSKLTTLMHQMKAGQCTKQRFDEEYKELIKPYEGAFSRFIQQQQVQATQQQENAADKSTMDVIVDESSSSSSASAPSPAQQESLALHRMSKDQIRELLLRYKNSDRHQKQQMRDTIEGLTAYIQQIQRQQRQQIEQQQLTASTANSPAAGTTITGNANPLLACQQALSVQPQLTSMNIVDKQRPNQLQHKLSTSSISPSVARPAPRSSKVATHRHHPYAVSGAYSSRIRTRNQALKMLSTLQPSFKLVQTEGGFTMKIEAFIAHEKIETFHAPEYSEEEYEEQETFYASFKRLSREEQEVKYKEKYTTRSEVLAIWDTIKPRLLSKLCKQFKDIDPDAIDRVLMEHCSFELAVRALTDINI